MKNTLQKIDNLKKATAELEKVKEALEALELEREDPIKEEYWEQKRMQHLREMFDADYDETENEWKAFDLWKTDIHFKQITGIEILETSDGDSYGVYLNGMCIEWSDLRGFNYVDTDGNPFDLPAGVLQFYLSRDLLKELIWADVYLSYKGE
jgi:hypothetical protein